MCFPSGYYLSELVVHYKELEVLILFNKTWGQRTCFIHFVYYYLVFVSAYDNCWNEEENVWKIKGLLGKNTALFFVFIFNFVESVILHLAESHWISHALSHFLKWRWRRIFKLIWGGKVFISISIGLLLI